MSIATAPAPAQRSTARSALRPRLRLTAQPLRTKWRPSFPVLCVTILGGCLVVLLGINIVLARGAFTEQQLTAQQTALMETQQALGEKVARNNAPDVLAKRARDLGMIPNSSPAFIDMSTGKILGAPNPATLNKTPAHSDLAANPLTPEQQAAAVAAANGGVGAIGADPNQATDSAPLTGATPSATASPSASASPSATQNSTSPTPAIGNGATGDGAVPIGANSTTAQPNTTQGSAGAQAGNGQTSLGTATPVAGNR